MSAKTAIAAQPHTTIGNATFIEGGLGAIKGLRCSGVYAGFRRNPERRDLALVVTSSPAVASAVFTKNIFCAAPVCVSQKHLAHIRSANADRADAGAGSANASASRADAGAGSANVDSANAGRADVDRVNAVWAGEDRADFSPGTGEGLRAIILNSGNANAATGDPGYETAKQTAELVAQHLNCLPHQVLVASTGVIGVPLSLAPFEKGVPLALAALGSDDGTAHDAGLHAAQAIMTTDTYAKHAAVSFATTENDGTTTNYKIAGMVKGSGMISPDMATLLGVFATDAQLTQEAADKALKQVVDLTLNKVTIDSDTSTNDSIFFVSTGAAAGAGAGAAAGGVTPDSAGKGAAGATFDSSSVAVAAGSSEAAEGGPAAGSGVIAGKVITPGSPQYEDFVAAFRVLSEDLTRQIAHDGEGATKLVTVNITGASDDADADKAGRAVANSPLVKTAIAGHDANWGRIAMAIGKSGASFAAENVTISFMDMLVCKDGLPVPFDEAEALRRFDEYPEIVIDVELGAGQGKARLWTCDFTHGYISINGDYRS